MFRKIILFILFISSVLPFHLRADQFGFKQLNSLNGLSHNTVYDIEQDNLGYMWFATREGLNRFDGNRNEIYKPPLTSEGESSDFRIVFHHSSGELFAATPEKLYWFNKNENELAEFKFTEENGRVISINELNNNEIIILTPKGLFRINVNNQTVAHFFTGNIMDIMTLHNGSVVATTAIRRLLKID